MHNNVGRKAQKCKTSLILDEVFEEGGDIGSFTIPHDERDILQAQLSVARRVGTYEPLPGLSIAQSLEVGLAEPGQADDGDTLTFIPCKERGWVSERQAG